MTGYIKSFYKGSGWITGDDGKEYFAHYSDLEMKERNYKRGRKVTFVPEDQGREHLNATHVFVEVPAPKPRTGVGQWVGTDVKGRKRCTDCNSTTELDITPFCPHCGASMNEDSIVQAGNNEVERMREEPVWKWTKLEYGFRCGCCKLIYPYPSKYCPHCGKFLRKKYSEVL